MFPYKPSSYWGTPILGHPHVLKNAILITLFMPRLAVLQAALQPCWAPVHRRFFQGDEFLSSCRVSFSSFSLAVNEMVKLWGLKMMQKLLVSVFEITLLRVIPTMAFNSSHLAFCLANLLAFYLAFCLKFYLSYLLAFYLEDLLTFYLAFSLAFYVGGTKTSPRSVGF